MGSSRRRPSLFFFALVSLALATSVHAAPIGVVFDGPTQSGQHFGISAARAAAAEIAGVPIQLHQMSSARGQVSIIDQSLESITLTPGDLITPFAVGSTWTAQNVSGAAITDIVYLVFTTADPRTVDLSTGPAFADYDETQVGLRLDPATGWVLLQTSAAGVGTLYYPAIPLGPLAANQQKQFDVTYFQNQLITFQDGGNTVLPLPRLRISMVTVPIPEPATALLLCAGLLGLAARARKRS